MRVADGLVVRHEKIERMPMRCGKAAVCAERMEQRSPEEDLPKIHLWCSLARLRRDG